MGNAFGSVAAWSARHPWVAVLLTLAVVAVVGAGISQAEPGRMGELFVPDDLEALETQRRIEAIWGETESAFILYLTDDPTDPDLLRAVASDAEAAARVPGAVGAEGLPTVLEARLGDLDAVPDDRLRAAAESLRGTPAGAPFLSDDALLVRVTLEPVDDIPATTDALDAVGGASRADADVRTAGVLYVEQYQNDSAGGDVRFLMPLSLATIIVFLSFLFRRAQDVVVPLLTVMLSIVMAYGTVAWAGMPLAPPSFIVMPLLLGLGIDYMLHVVYAYREEPTTKAVARRFRGVGRQVGYPVFFTAATTLIGFGSFLISNIPQIRTWGLLIGSGALYAFLLGFIFLPALYRLRRRVPRRPRALPLGAVMDRIARLIMGHRKTVLALVLLTTAGLGVAASQVTVEDTIEFDLDASIPAVADLDAVQDRFGGQSVALVLIEARGADRERLAALETALDDHPASGFVDGPVHRLQRAGTPEAPLVGPTTKGVATDSHWLLTIGYRHADRHEAVAAIEGLAAASGLQASLTGPDVLQAESEEVFLESLFLSTAIALVLVVLLLVLVFRNVLLACLAFLPLLVTIVWQLGLQTLVGIPINPITGVMTAMILGVGVDYSLHVMVHFRDARRVGASSRDAAAGAMRSVGRPILAASLTTVFAFSVLGFSSLVPLQQFGIVAAIVVTCAFVVSLTLLPVLASYLPDAQRARVVAGTDVRPVRPWFADPAVQAWFEASARRGIRTDDD